MQPTSSVGSAKMYLDSVLNKDKKNGTDSKAMSRKQGNVIVVWEGGSTSAWSRRWPATHEVGDSLAPGRILIDFL